MSTINTKSQLSVVIGGKVALEDYTNTTSFCVSCLLPWIKKVFTWAISRLLHIFWFLKNISYQQSKYFKTLSPHLIAGQNSQVCCQYAMM